MNNHEGSWLSIVDYSKHRGKSVSTIRRYIKAERVKHKVENGKYFIWANSFKPSEDEKIQRNLHQEIQHLKQRIQFLAEENTELKMLIQVYENQKYLNKDMPEIPRIN